MTTPPTRTPARGRAVTAAMLAALLPLAACSAASEGGSAASDPVVQNQVDDAQGAVAGGAPMEAAPAAGDVPRGAAKAAVTQAEARKILRKASVTLQVEDVPGVAARIRGITVSAGGEVVSETLTDARSGSTTGTLTLAVPAERLDATLEELGALGRVVTREISSEDATATYADAQGRAATMKASIDRVRALMADATKISDVVALEQALAQREAEYEALQRTLRAIDARAARSSVTVTLRRDSPSASEGPGFLGGLARGWEALVASASAAVVVVGMLLPWAVLAALFGWPLWWWLRRRARRPHVGTSHGDVGPRPRRRLRVRRSAPDPEPVSPDATTQEPRVPEDGPSGPA